MEQLAAAGRWGVQILGHGFDLADWEEVLLPPFDPWVDRTGDEYVLRSSRFEALETAGEVYDEAAVLIGRLNGAMWIARRTRPVRGEGIIEFRPDGTRHLKLIALKGHFEGRSRMRAVAELIGPDGNPIPPPPPQASEVQQWAALAEEDGELADALVYFGRGEWFDIFKAIECLEDREGGEAALRNLSWIGDDDFKRLKQTANSFRHRKDGKHKPPAKPMEHKEALRQLGTMVRCALKSAVEKGG